MYFDPLTLQVKMWVQLLIPRIEDGNNFGVSIQVRHLQSTLERKVWEYSPFLCISVFLFFLFCLGMTWK